MRSCPPSAIALTASRTVVGVPALAGGGLLDLDSQRPAYLLQIARPPIVREQRPLRFQRLRHHLLGLFAADGLAEEWGAEQAESQAGDEGGRIGGGRAA